jgi:hypothetical protein
MYRDDYPGAVVLTASSNKCLTLSRRDGHIGRNRSFLIVAAPSRSSSASR